MEASEHTPGPWGVEHPYQEPGTYITGPDSGLICRVREYSHPNRMNAEEREANAALIAAAPDLLAALEGLSVALSVMGVLDTEGEAGRDAADALETARTAISKARGQA